jgi:hypothetical protein
MEDKTPHPSGEYRRNIFDALRRNTPQLKADSGFPPGE